ncbi:integrase family protein [Xenorhabdus koppenhoeferi]|uniref:tyrosine-type recombinase/integrase n=1 Tax=Xenorhabdus koppenhoeferi TaxID=351659 RepID=UPI002B4127F8|nr:integrase family protein [Xenorhabdus sp. Vera]
MLFFEEGNRLLLIHGSSLPMVNPKKKSPPNLTGTACLFVSPPKGKIIFQFRYRWNDKGDRIDIGTYPTTSLKDARDAVTFYRGELEQHRNPKIVKRVRKESALNAITVEELIRNWWKTTMQGVKVKADEILRSFELHIFPKIGKLPHDDVALHVWLSLIKLCLLFGCRISELLKAKIPDFDYENNIWTVPPKNHKTGRRSKKPIIRPIIPEAKTLIEQAKKISHGNEYLFTVSGGGPFVQNSHSTMIGKLSRKMAEYFDDSYTSWSAHDLRRTMRTGVSELTALY